MRHGYRLGHTRDFYRIILIVIAVLGGCAAPTRMSAHRVRNPVLVGPVACIGCAPSPASKKAVFADSASSSRFIGGGGGVTVMGKQETRPGLDEAPRLVPDPCRADLQVTLLKSQAFGIGFLPIFGSWLDIKLEAYPTKIENGTCWQPPETVPSTSSRSSSPSSLKQPEIRR